MGVSGKRGGKDGQPWRMVRSAADGRSWLVGGWLDRLGRMVDRDQGIGWGLSGGQSLIRESANRGFWLEAGILGYVLLLRQVRRCVTGRF